MAKLRIAELEFEADEARGKSRRLAAQLEAASSAGGAEALQRTNQLEAALAEAEADNAKLRRDRLAMLTNGKARSG